MGRNGFVPLAGAGSFPDLAAERSAASSLFHRRVRIDGERHATLVARRRPKDDVVVWTVFLDADLDPDDPLVRRRVEETRHQLSSEIGLSSLTSAPLPPLDS
ncbi:MAG: hypothetical protein GEU93_16050 [Propionibacteriales bacterium]|nr:hypothetical protein [Propionibacteriales bacterium]